MGKENTAGTLRALPLDERSQAEKDKYLMSSLICEPKNARLTETAGRSGLPGAGLGGIGAVCCSQKNFQLLDE